MHTAGAGETGRVATDGRGPGRNQEAAVLVEHVDTTAFSAARERCVLLGVHQPSGSPLAVGKRQVVLGESGQSDVPHRAIPHITRG